MMCSFASVIKKGRSRYELTLLHLIISSLIQCHKKKNILLSIILIYFRAHIYSLELHHSNECFYLMETPFTRITISRCPWYMRTKRQSPSNILLTILIYFLAQSGTPTSMIVSIRPDRKRAGSTESISFVVPIKNILSKRNIPSISVSN